MIRFLFFNCCVFFTLLATAQNCVPTFNTNCWFTAVSYVQISDDGKKAMAIFGQGPAVSSNSTSCTRSTNTVKVYDATSSAVEFNSSQSANPGGNFFVSDFTANNGYFYTKQLSGDTYNVFFKSAAGVETQVSGNFNLPKISRVVGSPNKVIIYENSTKKIHIADAASPAAAFTSYTVAGTLVTMEGRNLSCVASSVDDRIYYTTTENESGTTIGPNHKYKIKAVTFTSGTTPTGWADIVLHRGMVAKMGIRPTDGRVFARTKQTDQHDDFHGVVVFNKNGTLSTDMNMVDLSLMGKRSSSSSEGDRNIAFDSDGNIYANLWDHSNQINNIAVGLMKFDPKGNLDLGFLRNGWNSYGLSTAVGANSFDISDAGIIIKCTHGSSEGASGSFAYDINHVNTNNEDPATTYSEPNAINPPLFFANPLKYNSVQFIFNNGKLVRPSSTTATINANCGIAPTYVAPTIMAAAGSLNCNGIAFINAPIQGTASTVVLKVPINVTTAGTFRPITVTGSGMSLQDSNANLTTTTTGIQDFYITLKYDGTNFGQFSIVVGGAGTGCTADLTDQTKKHSSVIDVWTSENCSFKSIGPELK